MLLIIDQSQYYISLSYKNIMNKLRGSIKNVGFANSKLKEKNIAKLCPDTHKSNIYNLYNRI